jgi:thiamine biosynthesis lipoprotein
VDEVAELLDARALPDYLVEIGGEMRMRGTNARSELWAIAVETPDRAGRSVQTVLRLTDSAMATSGDYRNFFEHDGRFYSHTIDPRTGYPVSSRNERALQRTSCYG